MVMKILTAVALLNALVVALTGETVVIIDATPVHASEAYLFVILAAVRLTGAESMALARLIVIFPDRVASPSARSQSLARTLIRSIQGISWNQFNIGM